MIGTILTGLVVALLALFFHPPVKRISHWFWTRALPPGRLSTYRLALALCRLGSVLAPGRSPERANARALRFELLFAVAGQPFLHPAREALSLIIPALRARLLRISRATTRLVFAPYYIVVLFVGLLPVMPLYMFAQSISRVPRQPAGSRVIALQLSVLALSAGICCAVTTNPLFVLLAGLIAMMTWQWIAAFALVLVAQLAVQVSDRRERVSG